MKKAMITLMMLIVAVTIVGCRRSEGRTPTIDVSEIVALRTTLTFEVEITDPDQIIVAGSLEAVLYRASDSARINARSFEVGDEGEAAVINFTNLEVNQTYRVRISATYNRRAHVMSEFNAQTSVDGSEEQPHEIRTLEDLLRMRHDAIGHFKLMNDIDLEGEEWTPVFNSITPLRGSFDGNGFTISNYKITRTTQYVGFFGYNRGTIKNLTLDDVVINVTRSSDFYVGTVVAFNIGTVENVHVNNADITVSTAGSARLYLGGAVAYNDTEGLIKGAHVSDLTLSGNSAAEARIGGVIGFTRINSRAENVSATGSIQASLNVTLATRSADSHLFVGGLVGDNRGVNLNDGFANVDITASSSNVAATMKNDFIRVGGIAGYNVGAIRRVVASGQIDVTSSDAKYVYVGGIIGENFGSQGRLINAFRLPASEGSESAEVNVNADYDDVTVHVNGGIGRRNQDGSNSYQVLEDQIVHLNGDVVALTENTMTLFNAQAYSLYEGLNFSQFVIDALIALGYLTVE